MLTICSVALRFDFNPAPSTLCSQFDSSEIAYETHLTRMRDQTELSEISTEMEVAFFGTVLARFYFYQMSCYNIINIFINYNNYSIFSVVRCRQRLVTFSYSVHT